APEVLPLLWYLLSQSRSCSAEQCDATQV
ncbi:unnamed protein product, partial [Caretta caretta]